MPNRCIVLVLIVGSALIITPGNNEVAVAEAGDRRLVLGTGIGIGVDQELVAHLDGVGIKPLASQGPVDVRSRIGAV